MNATQIAAVAVLGVVIIGGIIVLIAGVMSVFGFSRRQQQIDAMRGE